jgi:hypothetical protein
MGVISGGGKKGQKRLSQAIGRGENEVREGRRGLCSDIEGRRRKESECEGWTDVIKDQKITKILGNELEAFEKGTIIQSR